VSGYRVTYLGTELAKSAQKNTVKARVRIEHGGRDLGVYAPSISTFPGATDGIATPSVRTGLLRDVYLTLVSSPNERGRVTIGVAINPMVVWIWIGGGLIAIGTALALLPQRRRVVSPVGNPDAPAEDLPEPEVVSA
jgi:cytochrome c-type biogenesis protein CcmF